MRLLRGVSGESLPCGCLIGVYETYEGTVVRMIDATGDSCPHPHHRVNAELPSTAVPREPSPLTGRT
jgi:hypothetical protein